MRIFIYLATVLMLTACKEEQQASDPPVRGLKTHLVENSEQSTIRRFPSVLEPTSLNTLSFEVSGKLGEVSLQVGQRVSKDAVLAALDTNAFEIQVESARAGVSSAEAAFANSSDTLARQEELLKRGSTTKASVDAARTEQQINEAQLKQALRSLDTARDSLSKAVLKAPFDGIVNSVEVQSFATISPGTQIMSIYSPDAFEVSFSANFDTVSQLVVGTPASVRLADRPDISLGAVISELGSRADAVSSFPIVLTLNEAEPVLKAGMAVEASIELPLPTAEGFTLPLSAVIKEGDIGSESGNPNDPGPAEVFVYDEATSTVVRREVTVAGVRENSLIIIDGLALGDLVASAGVSFLREGQKVKLLTNGE